MKLTIGNIAIAFLSAHSQLSWGFLAIGKLLLWSISCSAFAALLSQIIYKDAPSIKILFVRWNAMLLSGFLAWVSWNFFAGMLVLALGPGIRSAIELRFQHNWSRFENAWWFEFVSVSIFIFFAAEVVQFGVAAVSWADSQYEVATTPAYVVIGAFVGACVIAIAVWVCSVIITERILLADRRT